MVSSSHIAKSSGHNLLNSSKKKDFPPPVVASVARRGLFRRSDFMLLAALCFILVVMTLYVNFNVSSRPTRGNLAILRANYTCVREYIFFVPKK